MKRRGGQLIQLMESLTAVGLRPSKNLGQNFIIDPNLLGAIAKEADLLKGDIVLEVGTGSGWLTRLIAAEAGHVISVEIDRRLYEYCRSTLSDLANLTLIHADVLETKNRLNPDVVAAIKEHPGRFKVVANIPFCVSSPLMVLLYESGLRPDRIVVTLQEEVAHRLISKAGTKDYGTLTVLIGFFAEVRMVRRIGAKMFWPRPLVNATVVCIDARRTLPDCEYDAYKRVVSALFTHRRKTLSSALRMGLGLPADSVRAAIEKAELSPRLRGECLVLDELCRLARAIPE